MPTYIYKFKDNDDRVEIQQSMSEDALKEIDGREVERVITGGAGFLLDSTFTGESISRGEARRKFLENDPLKTTLPEYRVEFNKNVVWHDHEAANHQQKLMDAGL